MRGMMKCPSCEASEKQVKAGKNKSGSQRMKCQACGVDVYFSDAFPSWEKVFYLHGAHVTSRDKSQTYAVEGDNAELRHYLARLARKSRCFSRFILTLQTAIKLFVYAWNARQLHKQRFPNYATHVKDFAYP